MALAREWKRLGCAAALGAIVAFPAGMMFSGRPAAPSEVGDSQPAAAPGRHGIGARKPFSPNVLGDPYVLQQHREIVEALENACRNSGEGCAEAKQARQYLLEREANPTR